MPPRPKELLDQLEILTGQKHRIHDKTKKHLVNTIMERITELVALTEANKESRVAMEQQPHLIMNQRIQMGKFLKRYDLKLTDSIHEILVKLRYAKEDAEELVEEDEARINAILSIDEAGKELLKGIIENGKEFQEWLEKRMDEIDEVINIQEESQIYDDHCETALINAFDKIDLSKYFKDKIIINGEEKSVKDIIIHQIKEDAKINKENPGAAKILKPHAHVCDVVRKEMQKVSENPVTPEMIKNKIIEETSGLAGESEEKIALREAYKEGLDELFKSSPGLLSKAKYENLIDSEKESLKDFVKNNNAVYDKLPENEKETRLEEFAERFFNRLKSAEQQLEAQKDHADVLKNSHDPVVERAMLQRHQMNTPMRAIQFLEEAAGAAAEEAGAPPPAPLLPSERVALHNEISGHVQKSFQEQLQERRAQLKSQEPTTDNAPAPTGDTQENTSTFSNN